MRYYVLKGPGIKRYAASLVDAGIMRTELVEKFKCQKSDIIIDQTVVSTQKDELLAFINNLCASFDQVKA